ncbi:MAG: hypothetical protein Ct9H300mP15_21400 [Gemmatimonadota bacterium]|nr:MAG: hypothetical protein Ct9H300mP15_21400 [Gemmatimonadota bacterium]
MLFFVVTFIEQHLYLIPSFFRIPCKISRCMEGNRTLGGSLISLSRLGYLHRGTHQPNPSRPLKLLCSICSWSTQSFTNFAHHTYHFPGSLGKWISFVVSMAESRFCVEPLRRLGVGERTKHGGFCATRESFAASKYWTVFPFFSNPDFDSST